MSIKFSKSFLEKFKRGPVEGPDVVGLPEPIPTHTIDAVGGDSCKATVSIPIINPEPQPIEKAAAPAIESDFPPWEPPPPNAKSIVAAMDDLWHERRKGRLFIVSRSTQRMYEVINYDGTTGTAELKSVEGVGFEIKVAYCEGSAPLEAAKYYPIWA